MGIRSRDEEGSSLATAALAEPCASASVEIRCQEETYDSSTHNALWQNDLPFVLELCTGRHKKCHGCRFEFAPSKESGDKFVISHEEMRAFWKHGRRAMGQQKAFYHCSASCITPIHPYFKPREVTATPAVAMKLTKGDAELLKCRGINLSFLGDRL